MANDSHIVRHDDAHYPSGRYGGWSAEQWETVKTWPTVEPRMQVETRKTVARKPGILIRAFAWLLGTTP